MCALNFYFANKLLKKFKVGRSPNAKSGSKVAEHNQDRLTERGRGGEESTGMGIGSVKSFRRNTRGISFNMEEFNGK